MSSPATNGVHALADGHGCDVGRLEDESGTRDLLARAVVDAGATLLEMTSHKFSPGGVTVVALLAESHASVHTWPETGAAAVDAFTCGTADAEAICRTVLEGLGATTITCQAIPRLGAVPSTIAKS